MNENPKVEWVTVVKNCIQVRSFRCGYCVTWLVSYRVSAYDLRWEYNIAETTIIKARAYTPIHVQVYDHISHIIHIVKLSLD